jgi:pyruvate/2-oxoglutarate dehydrogenase complex dihydrolipoamide acyltransferase (E2) component
MSELEFILPDVGEGLEEAEILEWLVSPGDPVRRDQPLLEILTDKSQTELPSPAAGVIQRLGPDVGDIAHVGDLLVVITVDGQGHHPPAKLPSASTAPAPAHPAITQARHPGRRPKASPAVRRKARDAGVDLSSVTGTGPGGRVTQDDLERARSAQARPRRIDPVQPVAVQPDLGQMVSGEHPLRGIRRVTAQAMERSWSIPHIHGMDEIDATNLLNGRRRIRDLSGERGDQLTPLAFLVTAVARSLRRYPVVNASIDTDSGTVTVHDRVDIGIAVATPDGLLVPVIRDADLLDLLDLASEISRLTTAARDRTITAEQMRNGTCTVTNYGSLGGRFSSPIIRSPEVCIVGFGAIRDRPFVVDGSVMARPTLPVVTGADHRLIDGDVLTAFQEHVCGLLTDPVALMVR